MNLDERLPNIKRAKWTFEKQQQLQSHLQIQQQRKKSAQLWTYRSVLAVTIAILLFFFIDLNTPTPLPSEQASVQSELEKITVLKNEKPYHELNLKSPFYFQKSSTVSESYMKSFAYAIETADRTEWNGEIVDRYGVLDILVAFENGETRYFKLSTEGPRYLLIEVETKQIYTLPNDELSKIYSSLYDLTRTSTIERWKLYALALLGTLLLLYSFLIERKQYLKDELGEKKKSSRLFSVVTSLLYTVPIFFSEYLIGAKHAGFIVLCLIASLVLTELYEIHHNIKRANWSWFTISLIISVAVFIILFI